METIKLNNRDSKNIRAIVASNKSINSKLNNSITFWGKSYTIK